MPKSDVTLKVTQSYTFRFKFGFETPKLFLKEIQKKIIIRNFSKTSSFRFSFNLNNLDIFTLS